MEHNFSKSGIKEMLGVLFDEWNTKLDKYMSDNEEGIDTEEQFIKLDIDGQVIKLPLDADAMNSIELLLKDVYYANYTGEATIGNTRKYFDRVAKRFEETDIDKCSFCGSTTELPRVDKEYADGVNENELYYYVVCPDCGVSGKYCDTIAEAVATWNRRV